MYVNKIHWIIDFCILLTKFNYSLNFVLNQLLLLRVWHICNDWQNSIIPWILFDYIFFSSLFVVCTSARLLHSLILFRIDKNQLFPDFCIVTIVVLRVCILDIIVNKDFHNCCIALTKINHSLIFVRLQILFCRVRNVYLIKN